MTTSTTQEQGVRQEDVGAQTAEKLSRRDQAMQALSTSRNESFEQESGIKLSPVVLDPEDHADPAAQLAAQLAAEAKPEPVVVEPVVAPTSEGRTRVKIDGEERDVTQDELVRNYQKNSAADRRLAEATKIRRDAEEEATRIIAEATSKHVPATQPVAQVATGDAGKNFLSAMFAGDEEKALTAFNEAVSSAVAERAPVAPTLDTALLTQQLVPQVQQQLEVESALRQSRKDYPDLYADPDIEALAARKLVRMQQDEGMAFTDALDTLHKEFATKFNWKVAGRPEAKTATTTVTDPVKQERKANIDNPRPVNAKTVSGASEPQSTSDTIAAMRKSRGLESN